ncbi:MAG: ATP-binding protein [Chloroflexota bacterium]
MAQDNLHAQLTRLLAADLVRLVRSQPDLEYWFKHAVIHESVYMSLLKSTRSELHLRVAEAIEILAETGDKAALLAFHYERAGRDRKAFEYAVVAGDQALRTYALREAIGFYDRALAMAGRLGEGELQRELYAVYASRGKALQSLGNREAALRDFEAQVKVAWAIGEPALQAEALNQVVTMQILGGAPTPELARNLEESLRLAQLSGDPFLVGRTLWNTGLAYRFPEPERAIEYLQQAYAMASAHTGEGVRWDELAAYVLIDLSTVNFVVGRIDRARKYSAQALTMFRALDHRPMLADALSALGMLTYLEGNPVAARKAVEEGMAISRALENDWVFAYCSVGLAMLEADAGRLEEAIRAGTAGLAAARVARFAAILGMVLDILSRLYYETGRPDLGEALALEAAQAVDSIGAPIWSGLARAAQGRVALERGDYERAWALLAPLSVNSDERRNDLEAVMSSCATIARAGLAFGHNEEVRRFLDWFLPLMEQYGVWRHVADVLYWYGRLEQADGNWAAAEGRLSRARDLYERAESRGAVWRADAALAEVYAALGDSEKASTCHERASQMVSQIASEIADAEVRRSFMAYPDVARVLAG